jgi:hypothetical protein
MSVLLNPFILTAVGAGAAVGSAAGSGAASGAGSAVYSTDPIATINFRTGDAFIGATPVDITTTVDHPELISASGLLVGAVFPKLAGDMRAIWIAQTSFTVVIEYDFVSGPYSSVEVLYMDDTGVGNWHIDQYGYATVANDGGPDSYISAVASYDRVGRTRVAATQTAGRTAISILGNPVDFATDVANTKSYDDVYLGGNSGFGSSSWVGYIREIKIFYPRDEADLPSLSTLPTVSTEPGDALASGSSTASGAGASIAGTAGSASGSGSGAATGDTVGAGETEGAASGGGSVSGVGGSVASSSGSASGSGSADFTSTAHRYWRIQITAVTGTDYVNFSTLELYSSVYGANIASGGTASASSTLSSFTPDLLFDGDPLTFWHSATSGSLPEWVAYDFGAGNEKEIVSIGIRVRDGNVNRAPRSFDVQWSDDGSSWTTAWSVSGASAWSDQEFRAFVDPGETVPSYSGSPYGTHSDWRIVMTDSAYSTYYSVAELEFRATPSGADQATGGTAAASSILSSTFDADKAFDNDGATLYHTNGSGTQWLRYSFGSPVAVAQIAILARNDSYSTQTPSAFALQFADSSSGPWRTVLWRGSETSWGAGETRTFTDSLYV